MFHAHSPERGNSFSKPGKNRSLKIQLSPLVRPCFKAEKTPAQNWSVGLFSRASLALRSETDSRIEPAKQRYKRFSFCHDTFLIQQNKTRQEAKQNPLITQPEPDSRFPVFHLFVKNGIRQNRLFLFVRLGAALNFEGCIPSLC